MSRRTSNQTTTYTESSHTIKSKAYDLAGNTAEQSITVTVKQVPKPPRAATLVSPSGTIGSPMPVFTWNAVADSTWYYLWVDWPSGNVIMQWYKTEQVCTGATCSIGSPKTLANGAHSWRVQTWNSVGYGPWSAVLQFTVSPMVPGPAFILPASSLLAIPPRAHESSFGAVLQASRSLREFRSVDKSCLSYGSPP